MKTLRRLEKRRTGDRGFSLAEVMVAMFVIVVGIGGVTATIWWGSQKSDAGKLIQEASGIGRILIEHMASSGQIFTNASPAPPAWFDAASGINDAAITDRSPIDAPPFDASQLLMTHIQNSLTNTQSDIDRFSRNITCTRMNPAGTGVYGEELCTVKITVFWQDKRSTTNPTLREHHVTHELVMAHLRDS